MNVATGMKCLSEILVAVPSVLTDSVLDSTLPSEKGFCLGFLGELSISYAERLPENLFLILRQVILSVTLPGGCSVHCCCCFPEGAIGRL